MAGLGSLVVSLTAETAQFRTAMEQASRTAQSNFKRIESLAATAAKGIGALFALQQGFTWVKSAIDAADALNDLSERTGIAVDELSRLQFAAKQNNLSNEELATGLNRLARSMVEATDGTSNAGKAFAAMGIQVQNADGSLKSNRQVLGEIANRFASYADGAEKAALAQELFGRSGAQLILFLNQGEEGLRKLGMEAERLGAVIMPDAAKRAAEFNDNLDRMSSISRGLGVEIGNSLIPSLNRLMEEFMLVRKHGLGFMDVISMGVRFGNYQDQLRSINEELSVHGAQLSEARRASLERQKAVVMEAAQLDALKRAEGDLGDAISRRFMRQQEIDGKQRAPTLKKDPTKDKQAADEAQRLIDAQIEAFQKLTMTEEELATAAVFLAGGTMQQVEAFRQLFVATQQLRSEQEALADRNQILVELAGEYKQLAADTASPVQQLANEEARLEDLRKRLIAAGYEVVDVENKIAEARMNAFDKLMNVKEETKKAEQTFKEFGSAIGTAFEDAVISGKKLGDVLKSLEQDIIRVLMRKFVTQPLEGAVVKFAETAMSSVFGARAMGGPVRANSGYLVGERGPELFMPNQSGTIVPNGGFQAAAGQMITVTNNFSITGPVDRRSQQQIAAATGQGIQAAMGRNT